MVKESNYKMKRIIQLFNKVDGMEILRQYCRAHVLVFALVEAIILGFSKKSLEIVRLAVSNRILGKLRKRYGCFIKKYLSTEPCGLKRQRSKKVWICWLQGIEEAPELVKKCYQSLHGNLQDKEIILLTERNYRDYVCFPDYIQQKIDQGLITRTHMSDLLRLELLIQYGGTWIDATVYCSGNTYPKYLFESDLFVFQDLKPGLDGHATCISSWFMSSCTNHPILLLTRAMLYDYWKNNNTMIDYFLLHDMFQLALETYPEEWRRVVPFSNSIPHILLLRLFEEYDEKVWNAVKEMTCFHKMTYKFEEKHTEIKGTYYRKIFG